MTHLRLCPICRRALGEEAQEKRFHPFCSKRCADVDLGRWLKGNYAIPAVEADETTEETGGENDERDQNGNPPPIRH
jgi:endogenous inhibitor of DNA gyrase (YacG/DUF329 family)